LRRSLDYALQARKAVDMDDPSIEGLQTLLLLSMAFFAFGRGKKAYMTLCMKRLNFHPETVYN
jgi:3-dehydroquinate dehydratase-1